MIQAVPVDVLSEDQMGHLVYQSEKLCNAISKKAQNLKMNFIKKNFVVFFFF